MILERWQCPCRCKVSSRILPDGRRLVMATATGERFQAGCYHPACPDCPYEAFTVQQLVQQSRGVRDMDRARILAR